MAALPRLGPLVGGGQHTSILKYLFADMRCLVGRVCNNSLHLGECFGHSVVHISGGNYGLQYKAVLVAGRVGLIGKLPLVFPLYYRVVVIKAPLQGLCYTVRDAVDW